MSEKRSRWQLRLEQQRLTTELRKAVPGTPEHAAALDQLAAVDLELKLTSAARDDERKAEQTALLVELAQRERQERIAATALSLLPYYLATHNPREASANAIAAADVFIEELEVALSAHGKA